jgi:subtilisin family serine protease
MGRRTKLLILSILLATLLVIAGWISLAAARMAQVEDATAQLPRPNQISNAGDQFPPMAPGVVLIGLKPGITVGTDEPGVQASDASLTAAFADIGTQSIEPVFPNTRGLLSVASTDDQVDLSRIYRLRLAPDADVLRIVQDLSQNSAVAYAEPDYLARIITAPNDPLYPGQWGLSQINAPAAWDVVTGTTDVVVAVVDAGLDTSHPDLAGQLWINPGEIAGNSMDDDNNGYVDDVHGWNLVNNSADLSDNTGHGTQVAGVIAAATDNGEGVAGVCWNCRLMIVKVTQPGGVANYSDIAAGVAYAAQKGAEVINLSLGGYSDSATLHAAIAVASQTTVVVGGVGNDDSSNPFYPAAYDDYVLAVASTTISDTRVSTSNYGTWVDVSAPGEVISTTFSGGGYGPTSGTSMAAPFASGLAGLLRSQYPGWSANMARAQIGHTTDDIDSLNPGYESQLGSGRINAGQAVTTTPQSLLAYESHTVNGQPDGRPAPGSTVNLDLILYNDWADATNVQATLNTTDTYVTILAGTASYGTIQVYKRGTNATPFRFSVSSSAPYAHDIPFTLTVTADGGYAVDIPIVIPTSPGIIYVHGTLTTQTWTNDRTYIVDNNIGIAAGHVLTIEAGTEVRFDGDYSLSVAGTLFADGTAERPIRFTSNQANPAAGDWDLIKFLDSSVDATFDGAGNYTSGSILRHTIIKYGRGVDLKDAAPYIAYNTFDQISMRPNWFGWPLGISGSGAAGLIVAHNTFDGAGIYLWVSSYTVHYFSIIGNTVSNVPAQGIDATYPLEVTGNRVVNCEHGIFVSYRGLVSGNLLANNHDLGMWVGGWPEMTVVSNTVPFNGGAGIKVGWGSPAFHHNNLIATMGHYALHNSMPDSFDATGNWWSTTNMGTIQALIYDGYDDVALGIVDYSGYLSDAAQDAPAYVQAITLTPESPIGIQQVTFEVTFSRPMDQSTNPAFTFGATEPYTSFVVLDNAQWLSNRVWRATYDITSLVPRGTYTISVSGAKGTDGMEIPADTRFGFTVDYAGEITDQTPPNSPSVIAGGKEGDPSTVEAMWLAGDPDSPITGYRYAIGSAPGATDIVNWTFVGLTGAADTVSATSISSISRSGLGLVDGQQYWFAVQARNVSGLWSASGIDAFVAGQPSSESFSQIFLPVILKKR